MNYRDGQYLFQVDFKNLENALNRKGVVSGLEVSPVPNSLGVIVSSGRIIGDGYWEVASVTISIDPPSVYPRKDLVVCSFQGSISLLKGEESEALPPGSKGVFTYSPYPPLLGDSQICLAEIYVEPGATSVSSDNLTDRRILIRPVYYGIYDLYDWEGTFEEKFNKAVNYIQNKGGILVLPIGTFSNLNLTIPSNIFVEGSWLGTEIRNSTITIQGDRIYLKDMKINSSKINIVGSSIAIYNVFFENCNPAISCTLPTRALKISTCYFNNFKDIEIKGTFGTSHSIERVMIVDNISRSSIFLDVTGVDDCLINRNIIYGQNTIGGINFNITTNFFQVGPGTAIKIDRGSGTLGVVKIFSNMWRFWNGTGIESSQPGPLRLLIEHNVFDASVPCSINALQDNFVLIRENAFWNSIGVTSGSVSILDNVVHRPNFEIRFEGRGEIIDFNCPLTSISSYSTIEIRRLVLPPSYVKVVGRYFTSNISGSSIGLKLSNNTIDVSSSISFYGEEIYSTLLTTNSTLSLLLINSSSSPATINGGYFIMVM